MERQPASTIGRSVKHRWSIAARRTLMPRSVRQHHTRPDNSRVPCRRAMGAFSDGQKNGATGEVGSCDRHGGTEHQQFRLSVVGDRSGCRRTLGDGFACIA